MLFQHLRGQSRDREELGLQYLAPVNCQLSAQDPAAKRYIEVLRARDLRG
jgi:hypothetical protein